MIRRVCILGSFILLSVWQTSLAVTYPLPPEGSRLVGAPLTIQVPEHNTQPLETFAAQYGQGLSNMLEANPVLMFFTEIRLNTGRAATAYSSGNSP